MLFEKNHRECQTNLIVSNWIVSYYYGSYIISISKNEGPISEATNENERSHEEFQSMLRAIPLQDRCMENPLILVGVMKDFGKSKRYVMPLE